MNAQPQVRDDQAKPLEGLIVGLDLDGVCADFYGRFREIVADWYERPIDELPLDVSYGLPEWGVKPGEYESIHRYAVNQRELFSSLPMIPGARKHLRRLSGEGARIRIITHRIFIYYFHATAVAQTTQWLDKHGIPYWDLCFMADKEQVSADIFVEDAPKNVRRLRERNLYTICFANSTNKDVEPPRASTWEDAYRMIHEEVARRKAAGTFPRGP